jgi:hypothetical protein
VHAAFTGLWVQTHEPDEAEREIIRHAREAKWTIAVWDIADGFQLSNTLYVESDQLLDQHTRYGLIVSNGVRDSSGSPVQASEEFTNFRRELNFGQTQDPVLKEYRKDMLSAIAGAAQASVPASDVVTASIFTTQSATSILEKIRDQIHAAPAPAVNNPRVFNLTEVTGFKVDQQMSVSGGLTTAPFNPLPTLRAIPGAVGQIAFGSYVSPDYEVHPGEYIPAVGTRTGAPAVQGTNTIWYTMTVPSGTRPANGWPVAILGHGGGGYKDGMFGVPVIAAEMAANGIATIGINAVGQGYGSRGTLTISQTVGGPVTLSEGGRGIDQDGNGIIGNNEGLDAPAPRAIIRQRDGIIQTSADLMQLVRVIQGGVDVDGVAGGDLDPSHIYYFGASLSSTYGAPFLAVEQSVREGVLNTVGGSNIEINRLRPSRGDLAAAMNLAGRGLLNAPGIIKVDGRTANAPFFNENMPLRDGVPLTLGLADGTTQVIHSPWTNTVVGATAIQQVFDNSEWVSQPGNPVAYAPHLRKDPLPGVPVRPVIVQFDKGDLTSRTPRRPRSCGPATWPTSPRITGTTSPSRLITRSSRYRRTRTYSRA